MDETALQASTVLDKTQKINLDPPKSNIKFAPSEDEENLISDPLKSVKNYNTKFLKD